MVENLWFEGFLYHSNSKTQVISIEDCHQLLLINLKTRIEEDEDFSKTNLCMFNLNMFNIECSD